MDDTLLVTGASSGVGASLAERFAADFDVVAVARRVDRMRERYADAPVTPYELDLSEPAAIESTLRTVREDHGPVTHLVNNAAVNRPAGVADVDPDAFLGSMRVNALAPVLVLQAVLPDIREAGHGRVVNVTSGAAIDCPPGAANYAASKAALNVLTVVAASELAAGDADVKVNLMSPGPVRTEMAPDADLDPSVCHPTAEYLLTCGPDGPTGRFFWLGYEVPLFPDLTGVHWESGTPAETMREVPEIE